MELSAILQSFEELRDPEAVAGMARYGINPAAAYGINIPALRAIAKESGKDHALAQELWATGIHEARILASMVDKAKEVPEAQLEAWVMAFDSWDLCDQCCANLFEDTPWAYEKAMAWSERQEEFVKRAGFVMMARLAVSDKKAGNGRFLPFLQQIEDKADDSRNFVKKAVNWALRQIGKRNLALNQEALVVAQRLQDHPHPAARWVANDAYRELTSEAIQEKLMAKGKA